MKQTLSANHEHLLLPLSLYMVHRCHPVRLSDDIPTGEHDCQVCLFTACVIAYYYEAEHSVVDVFFVVYQFFTHLLFGGVNLNTCLSVCYIFTFSLL